MDGCARSCAFRPPPGAPDRGPVEPDLNLATAGCVRHEGVTHAGCDPRLGYDLLPMSPGWTNLYLAETEGFEPSIPFSRYAHLANECLQPLGHISCDIRI